LHSDLFGCLRNWSSWSWSNWSWSYWSSRSSFNGGIGILANRDSFFLVGASLDLNVDWLSTSLNLNLEGMSPARG
jgi:hypothetical protein